jgi:tRNA-5-methyluridine54 2-sulfurtransferase
MDKNLLPLPPTAKCSRCRGRGEIRLPHHHAIFCPECFVLFCQKAVERAMKKLGFSKEKPLLVAVSGGKDSLALWDLLNNLGYTTKGLHVTLGIAEFSDLSAEMVRAFAKERDLPWVQYSMKEVFGYTIEEIKARTRRKICSVCGFLKRQMLNRLTVREGFEAVATGHNLDDEAGRLLGNILRNRTQYLAKQYPYLPSIHPRMPIKLKPLYRLESQELRTYCRVKSISPAEGRCPLSRGATSHIVKEALEFLENKMPGTKRDFLFSYLDSKGAPSGESDIGTCIRCGEPAFGEVCSVCNLLDQLRERPGKNAE